MNTPEVVELYRHIRANPTILARLASQPDMASLESAAKDVGSSFGRDLSIEEVRQALAELPGIINAAAGEEELTDEELEIVSAGIQIRCNSGLSKL